MRCGSPRSRWQRARAVLRPVEAALREAHAARVEFGDRRPRFIRVEATADDRVSWSSWRPPAEAPVGLSPRTMRRLVVTVVSWPHRPQRAPVVVYLEPLPSTAEAE